MESGRSSEDGEGLASGLGALLDESAAFQALSLEARALLAGRLARREIGCGEVVVERGTEGTELFLIESGCFVVFLPEGNKELARLGRGEVFGEMSPLSGLERSATVRADEAGVVHVLGRADLHGLLRQIPGFAAHLLRSLDRYRR
jgi:CRP-like cAMP-binding protein